MGVAGFSFFAFRAALRQHAASHPAIGAGGPHIARYVNLHVSGRAASQRFEVNEQKLARAPHIKARLEVAERIAERRWTLHLADGATVHLPADRETRALEALVADARLARLLGRPGSVVDLRVPGRAAVRSAAPADLLKTSQLEPKQAPSE